MLGFGALGEFALGEGPTPSASPPATVYTTFSSSDIPVRKAGLTAAIIATTFVGFVSPPTPPSALVFSAFPPILTSNEVKAWEQSSVSYSPRAFVPTPSALSFTDFDLLVRKPSFQGNFTNAPFNPPALAVVQPYVFGQFPDLRPSKFVWEGWTNAPQVQTAVVATVTFGGFAEFDVVLHAKPIVSYDFKGFIFVQSVSVIVEAFDPFVKKRKRKAKVYDPYKEEAETKRLRRKAIEDAIYGPPVEYTLPPLVFPVDPKPVIPNLGDLPQIVLAAQQKAIVDAKLEQSKQDEDELESILKGLM